MGTFFYWIPSVTSVSFELINELGLEYALDHIHGRGCKGPTGSRGIMLAGNKDVVGEYRPDNQTWAESPGGSFWIGFNNDNKPTPESLVRDITIAGKETTLLDGSKWNVPVLQQWHPGASLPLRSSPLPCTLDFDIDGNIIDGPVLTQYSEMYDLALQVLIQMANRGSGSLSGSQLIKFAANVLGMNYRVSFLELSAKLLNCFSGDDALELIQLAIDFAGYEDALGNSDGRRARPDTDTPSGSNQSTQDAATTTDPQSAN